MRPLILMSGLILTACVPVASGRAPPLADLSQCGGMALHALVGQPVTALPKSGGWGGVRVIRPGMMVTMDFSASRLNVHLDGAGTILALECG